jgi:hypothetical protein
MIKNKAILEVKVGERAYQLELAPDSPLGEVHDALVQMRAYVVSRMVEEQKKTEEEKK